MKTKLSNKFLRNSYLEEKKEHLLTNFDVIEEIINKRNIE